MREEGKDEYDIKKQEELLQVKINLHKQYCSFIRNSVLGKLYDDPN